MAQHIQYRASRNPSRHSSRQTPQRRRKFSRPQASSRQSSSSAELCIYCGGGQHPRSKCRAANAVCNYCHKNGHFASVCNKRKTDEQPRKANTASVHSIIVQTGQSLNIDFNRRRRFFDIDLLPSGTAVWCSCKLQLDTGADLALLSKNTYTSVLGAPKLKPAGIRIVNADGNEIGLLGKLVCDVRFGSKTAKCDFYVTSNTNDLLGLELIDALGFQLPDTSPPTMDCKKATSIQPRPDAYAAEREETLSELQRQFPNVFSEGLGRCTQTQATVVLHPNAHPVFCKARIVAYARKKVNPHLCRLQDRTQRSSGSKLPSFPNPEHIFAALNGGRIFSKIDFSDAFAQIEVAEPFRKLLAINTHRGLFQMNRMPFGLRSAPGTFQKVMEQMLSGYDFAPPYLDDILIASKDIQEHKQHIRQVFERINSFGFKISSDKCELFKPELKYLGKIISAEGQRPDPDKIKALQNMPAPKNQTELRALLGLTTTMVLSSSNSTTSDVRSMLYSSLTRRGVGTLNINMLLSKSSKNCTPTSFSSIMIHQSRSWSLQMPPKMDLVPYSRIFFQMIEKEALGLVFALKKFHFYVFGRNFTLQTDHRPLLSIFGSKKGASTHVANRLQRWAIFMLAYDFTIEYKSTHAFGHADALSRLIDGQRAAQENDLVIAQAHRTESDELIIQAIQGTLLKAEDVRQATAADPIFSQVLQFLDSSWPDYKQLQQNPRELQILVLHKYEIMAVDGILLRNDRVLVPSSLRSIVLSKLHEGHQGTERMRTIARRHVYWPNIDRDIADFVRKCEPCMRLQKAPLKQPLYSWPLAKEPMERVHIDYAGPIDNRMFLVFVDAYSKWPEVYISRTATTEVTIRNLQDIFNRFGNPKKLVSDNGIPVGSLQSNGQAERFVDTLKRQLAKIRSSKNLESALSLFLRTYRFSPLTTGQRDSPAERFLHRMPTTNWDLIKPASLQQRVERNLAMERTFNLHHNAKTRTFHPQQRVWIEDPTAKTTKARWYRGVVLQRKGNVLYKVLLGGRTQTRHANHLRPDDTDVQENDYNTIIEMLGNLHPQVTLPEVEAEQDQVQREPAQATPPSILRRSTRNRAYPLRLSPMFQGNHKIKRAKPLIQEGKVLWEPNHKIKNVHFEV
uniref:RNA-directed DNA polymerase n=1 Tax=Acrobeloides nanus TaxID=290746 RepID=A0A914ENR5_9BILA